MSEREMLERAAAAAGLYYWIDGDALLTHGDGPGSTREWNPLTDDGDALRLAVRLRLTLCYTADETTVCAWKSGDPTGGMYEFMHPGEEDDAMRLAITRAAAALAPTAQGE